MKRNERVRKAAGLKRIVKSYRTHRSLRVSFCSTSCRECKTVRALRRREGFCHVYGVLSLEEYAYESIVHDWSMFTKAFVSPQWSVLFAVKNLNYRKGIRQL